MEGEEKVAEEEETGGVSMRGGVSGNIWQAVP